MKFISRTEWLARGPRNPPTKLDPAKARGIAVHYEAVDSSADSHGACNGRVLRTQRYHQVDKGWNDIAYSWLVCRHGFIYEGRGWGIRTAANGTDEGNDGYHAVCYLDDDREGTDLTAPAAAAMGEVVRANIILAHGNDVRPHSSFKLTSCPGDELRAWIAQKAWTVATPAVPIPPRKAPVVPPKPLPPPLWYRRTLRLTAPLTRGEDVRTVQRKLKARADALYGPDTTAKVRGFQKLHGLTPDGVVGPKTARRLA